MPARIENRGRRRVVLKPLDDDCLLDGQLHPSIAARLSRVRELPMTAVANLLGVERIDGRACLVWEYVEGRTLEEIVPQMSAAALDRATAELRLTVEAMHAYGIVHGAIHTRNVIIDDHGGVHLTHVSPLLHHDPAKDIDAVESVVHDAPDRRSLTAAGAVEITTNADEADEIRTPAIISAAVVAALGVMIVAFFIYFASLNQ